MKVYVKVYESVLSSSCSEPIGKILKKYKEDKETQCLFVLGEDYTLNWENAKIHGFWCKDLKKAGYNCTEVKEAGWSCNEVKEAGYLREDAIVAGYSHKERLDCGFDSSGTEMIL